MAALENSYRNLLNNCPSSYQLPFHSAAPWTGVLLLELPPWACNLPTSSGNVTKAFQLSPLTICLPCRQEITYLELIIMPPLNTPLLCPVIGNQNLLALFTDTIWESGHRQPPTWLQPGLSSMLSSLPYVEKGSVLSLIPVDFTIFLLDNLLCLAVLPDKGRKLGFECSEALSLLQKALFDSYFLLPSILFTMQQAEPFYLLALGTIQILKCAGKRFCLSMGSFFCSLILWLSFFFFFLSSKTKTKEF